MPHDPHETHDPGETHKQRESPRHAASDPGAASSTTAFDGRASPVLFDEKITRKPAFVYPAVGLVAVVVWAFIILEAGFGIRIGDTPIPAGVMWTFGAIFGVGLPALALLSHQRTTVTADEVRARLSPLWTFRIPVGEIREAAARRYRPMREYTGWGIRYMPKSGWAINIAGDRGVQLVLESGKRVLIASDRAEVLEKAIRRAMERAGASG